MNAHVPTSCFITLLIDPKSEKATEECGRKSSGQKGWKKIDWFAGVISNQRNLLPTFQFLHWRAHAYLTGFFLTFYHH